MDSSHELLTCGHEKGVYQDNDCQASPSSPSSIGEQQQEFYSPYPCTYHIEDIENITTDEFRAILSRHKMSIDTDAVAQPAVPEFLISNPSSSSKSLPDISTTTFAYYDTWGNADEIPTRVPSVATYEEDEGGFPPLIRCSENPRMGLYPDDFIVDIDDYDDYDGDDDDDYSSYDDSVVSEWSSFLTSIGNEAEMYSERDLFCCERSIDIDIESKDVGAWSVVSRASSTTLPQPYTVCSEGKPILIG